MKKKREKKGEEWDVGTHHMKGVKVWKGHMDKIKVSKNIDKADL